MKIVSVAQMQSIEKKASQAGISYETMMFNAGSAVADWVIQHLDATRGVVGLVGSGNNGGDTLIALKRLGERGFRTLAFLVRPRENDPLVHAYQEIGGVVVDLTEKENLPYLNAALLPGVILMDGMLGTGFHLPLRGSLMTLMTQIQLIIKNQSQIQIVAVDCPSGLDCNTGEAAPQCLKADFILTMAAAKKGLLRSPGNDLARKIHLMDIGIGEPEQYLSEPLPELIDAKITASLLPKRPPEGHKGTFGTCLLVAGTQQYTGAAYLAGKASYRAGCGLVNVATLPAVQESLSSRLIEAVWTILPEMGYGYDPAGVDILQQHLEKADSIALGPGWGLHASNQQFLEALLSVLPSGLPTIIDADGLKLLSSIEQWWQKVPTQTILTPHPGEMAYLTGLSIKDIQANRWEIAAKFASEWHVTLVLKGALSVIALPDGELLINPISDSALGTAGSGDVLTGLIGGLLAQGLKAQKAAILGVGLHGKAGIQAHHDLGDSASVTAVDILDSLPTVISELKRPV